MSTSNIANLIKNPKVDSIYTAVPPSLDFTASKDFINFVKEVDNVVPTP
jgi:hypothetical protein